MTDPQDTGICARILKALFASVCHLNSNMAIAGRMSSNNHHSWKLVGRSIHSFAVAIFIILLSTFFYLAVARSDASGAVPIGDPITSLHTGIAAGIAALVMLVGFVINSITWLQAGLLGAVFVYMAHAVVTIESVGWGAYSVWISFGLVVGSAGAWIYERAHMKVCPACGGLQDD